jgi:iron complex outermembrane receptor protein
MRFSKWLVATTAIALSFVGAQQAAARTEPAGANAPAVDDNVALDQIIVTAEKRSENLQTTAISISVLSGQNLEDRQVYSLADLGDGAIPSLKVAPFFSRPGALIMNIRGIGVLSDSNQPARDQGVGIYVDGVYLGRPQGLGTALYDVSSIEVLKGPQGTLFGRNTEGGAVSITTKKPTGEFGLVAKAGVSNYSGYSSEMHLDLPAVAGVAIKLSGVVEGRNGWVSNPLPSASDFGEVKKRALRARALWRPTDDISVDYAYDTAFDSTTTLYQQLLARSTYPTALKTAAANIVQADRAKVASIGTSQQPSDGNTWGHRLTAEWKAMPSLTLKSITSYRDLKQGQYDNGSVATSPGVYNASGNFQGVNFGRYSLATFNQMQFSQEFQVVGELPRLKYVAGALYYREKVSDDARTFTTNTFTDAAGLNSTIINNNLVSYSAIARASKVNTTSQGVFGQATYTPPILDDALNITLGARWTRDEKVGQLYLVNGALPVVNGVAAPRNLNTSWKRTDPLVNVSYELSKTSMVYAKYSTGYRSGGANSRSLVYLPFNPETATMYEIGSKNEFFDRRLRVNLAAYTGDYKDIQLDFSGQYVGRDPATGQLVTTLRTTTETINAPGAGKLRGFEADGAFAVNANLTLSASFAYNKVKIPATLNPFPQNVSGVLTQITVPIPIYQVYTPEKSGSITMDYERPFRGLKVVAHLDGNFSDGFYVNYTDVAYDPVTRAVTIKQPKGDSSFIVNGRISLAEIPAGGGKAALSLWSRNLFNEAHVFYRTFSDLQGETGFYNEPRTFGFEVSVKM